MAVAPKTPPRTTRPQRLLLLAGGLLAALLLLELGLRGTGFLLLTLRDLADRRRSGEKEEVRILCVGESTTYCGGSKSYPRQLEEILNRLGTALMASGRPEAAIERLQAAVRLRPGDAGAHNRLALALALAARPDEAAATYRRALALDPRVVDAPDNLFTVLGRMGRTELAAQIRAGL